VDTTTAVKPLPAGNTQDTATTATTLANPAPPRPDLVEPAFFWAGEVLMVATLAAFVAYELVSLGTWTWRLIRHLLEDAKDRQTRPQAGEESKPAKAGNENRKTKDDEAA